MATDPIWYNHVIAYVFHLLIWTRGLPVLTQRINKYSPTMMSRLLAIHRSGLESTQSSEPSQHRRKASKQLVPASLARRVKSEGMLKLSGHT